MPERGMDLGGFPRLAALKVEEVTSDSQVYNSGEDTWKVSRISSSLPALKTHCKK